MSFFPSSTEHSVLALHAEMLACEQGKKPVDWRAESTAFVFVPFISSVGQRQAVGPALRPDTMNVQRFSEHS
jgi:hypothetical protein